MFRKKLPVLLIGLAGASSAAVFADDVQINPSWYVMPQVGLMTPDESTMGSFVGVKVGKRFGDNLDVQIGYTQGQTKDKQAGYLSSKYTQDAIAIEGVYDIFSMGRLTPFVVGGIGYSKDNFVAEGNPQFAWQIGQPNAFANRDESTNSWLITAGAGLKYTVSSNMFVQADARYFISDSDTDGSNLYASVGLGWYLGQAPVAYKPVPEVKPEPVVEVKPEPVVEVKPEPVAEVKPEPVVEVKPKPKDVKLRNLKADNLFAKGSAVLGSKAALELDSAIASSGVDLKSLKAVKIIGHADRTGNVAANQKLSERRAEAVKALLVKKGVAENIITAQGKGETQPITSLKQCPKSLVGIKLSACLAPDRRIEIAVE